MNSYAFLDYIFTVHDATLKIYSFMVDPASNIRRLNILILYDMSLELHPLLSAAKNELIGTFWLLYSYTICYDRDRQNIFV